MVGGYTATIVVERTRLLTEGRSECAWEGRPYPGRVRGAWEVYGWRRATGDRHKRRKGKTSQLRRKGGGAGRAPKRAKPTEEPRGTRTSSPNETRVLGGRRAATRGRRIAGAVRQREGETSKKEKRPSRSTRKATLTRVHTRHELRQREPKRPLEREREREINMMRDTLEKGSRKREREIDIQPDSDGGVWSRTSGGEGRGGGGESEECKKDAGCACAWPSEGDDWMACVVRVT